MGFNYYCGSAGCTSQLSPCIASSCTSYPYSIPNEFDMNITLRPQDIFDNCGIAACPGANCGAIGLPSFGSNCLTGVPSECFGGQATITLPMKQVKPPVIPGVGGDNFIQQLWVNNKADYYGGSYILPNEAALGWTEYSGFPLDQQGYASVPNQRFGCLYATNFNVPWTPYWTCQNLYSPTTVPHFQFGDTVGVAAALYTTSTCGLWINVYVLDLSSYYQNWQGGISGPIETYPLNRLTWSTLIPLVWIGKHFQIAHGASIPGQLAYLSQDICLPPVPYDPCTGHTWWNCWEGGGNPYARQYYGEGTNLSAPIGGNNVPINASVDTSGGVLDANYIPFTVGCDTFDDAYLLQIWGTCESWNGEYELTFNGVRTTNASGFETPGLNWGWVGIINGWATQWLWQIEFYEGLPYRYWLYNPFTGFSMDVTSNPYGGSFNVSGLTLPCQANCEWSHTINWSISSLA